MRLSSVHRLVWTTVILLALAAAAYVAWGYPRLARNFPFAAASVGVALSATLLALDVRRVRCSGHAIEPAGKGQSMLLRLDIDGTFDDETTVESSVFARRLAIYLGTLLGYVALVRIVGVYAGSALFLILFLRFIAKVRTRYAVLSAVLTVAVLMGFQEVVDLRWPSNLLGW